MNTTQVPNGQHPEDITKADQITAMWKSLPADEYEAAQADFFAGKDVELFGVEIDLGMQDFDDVCAKWGDHLNDDEWWLAVVEAPYPEEYWQAKNEAWELACDIIDSKLISA